VQEIANIIIILFSILFPSILAVLLIIFIFYVMQNKWGAMQLVNLTRNKKTWILIILQFFFFSLLPTFTIGATYYWTGANTGGTQTIKEWGLPFLWVKNAYGSPNQYIRFNFFNLLGNFIIYCLVSVLIFYRGNIREWLYE